MRSKLTFLSLFGSALLLGAALLAGCDSSNPGSSNPGSSNPGSSDPGSSDPNSSSSVKVLLTDAPLEGVAEAHVTIESINLIGEAGATVLLSDEEQPFDLLTLQNGLTADLATLPLEDVPEGRYHQLRILIAEDARLVFDDGTETELKIPSGSQSGIKVKLDTFTVGGGGEVAITVDFDASKSFVKAGASGRYLFKPVLHAQSMNIDGEEKELGEIEVSGRITAVSDTTVEVEGIRFTLSSETEVEAEAPLAVGQFVELEAADRDDGTHAALEIEAEDEGEEEDEDGEEDDSEVEIKAPLDAVAAAEFTLAGVPFAVTADTQFEGFGNLSDLAAYTTVVEVEFAYNAEANAYTALFVELEGDD